MKRALDLSIALIGMAILTPLLGVLSLAVLLTSGKPAIFRQVRVGRDGRLFIIRKFRTMAMLPGAEGGSFEPGDLSRITAFGRLLRSSKIDELPQLWNVIKGDMSLVGPRPEVPHWVTVYPERWKRVLSVRPGMTDPSSIEYRDEERIIGGSLEPEADYGKIILPRKLDIYEEYLKNQSLIRDIRILADTFLRVSSDMVAGNSLRPGALRRTNG